MNFTTTAGILAFILLLFGIFAWMMFQKFIMNFIKKK